MSDFQVVTSTTQAAKSEEAQDNRSLVQKMFYDHDEKTGKLSPLPIVSMDGEDDWKRVNDCIVLMKSFRAKDPEYKGELQGRDVLVFGGRRKGRAGTGVELMLAVEDVKAFCDLATKVAGVVVTQK